VQRPRGKCPGECGLERALGKDGTIMSHTTGPTDDRHQCDGSRKAPKAQRKLKTATRGGKAVAKNTNASLDEKGYRLMQSRGQVAFVKVAKAGVVDIDGLGPVPVHAGDYLMRQHGDITPVPADIVERYWFPARNPDSVCSKCGCTQEDGCPVGCSWIGPNLCSACAPPRRK
jgi:hypothetical protein